MALHSDPARNIKPGKRTPGGLGKTKSSKVHPSGNMVDRRSRSKKPTSALGQLNRQGPHPKGPLTTAPAFTKAGKVLPPTGAPRLSRADAKLVKKAQAAKRPSRAQKDVLAAATARKLASNARRSSTLKAHHKRQRLLKSLAGKTKAGMYVPGGPTHR